MRVCYNGGYRTCAIHLRARSFGRACGGRLGERSPQPRLAAEMGKKAKGGGGGDKAAGPLPGEAEAKLLLHVAELEAKLRTLQLERDEAVAGQSADGLSGGAQPSWLAHG